MNVIQSFIYKIFQSKNKNLKKNYFTNYCQYNRNYCVAIILMLKHT